MCFFLFVCGWFGLNYFFLLYSNQNMEDCYFDFIYLLSLSLSNSTPCEPLHSLSSSLLQSLQIVISDRHYRFSSCLNSRLFFFAIRSLFCFNWFLLLLFWFNLYIYFNSSKNQFTSRVFALNQQLNVMNQLTYRMTKTRTRPPQKSIKNPIFCFERRRL